MGRVFIAVPAQIEPIIRRLIGREGGFVDHPADPGGATNMGITFKTLERWRGGPIDKRDVRNLTLKEAIQIYYQLYWQALKLHHIADWWVKEFIFDWCVNAGLKNPVRNIQRLVGVKSDGVLGPVTGNAIEMWMSLQGNQAWSKLCDCRVRWYIRLVETRHTSIVFLEGWFRRANDMRYQAPPFSNR